MTHALHLPLLLVLVAVIGLAIVVIAMFFSKKKRHVPVAADSTEVLRIQERLASSRIARRASGSRRKVVAIRPPAMDEAPAIESGKAHVAESHPAPEPPSEEASGH